MLTLVDDAYTTARATPSLVEISRHIRLAAEHLDDAYAMLAEAELADRATLQFTLYMATAKLVPVILALTREVANIRPKADT